MEVAEAIVGILQEDKAISAQLIHLDEFLKEMTSNSAPPYDACINFAYGEHGRFHLGSAPMKLDSVGIPNFGSDPLQMLLARNKKQTKSIAQSLGLKTTRDLFIDRYTRHLIPHMSSKLLPVIVKPNEGAAGLGMENHIYRSSQEAIDRIRFVLEAYPEGILIEKFVPGHDVTVAALSDLKRVDVFAYIQRDKDGGELPLTYMNAFTENINAVERGTRIWHEMAKHAPPDIVSEACEQTRILVTSLRIAGYVRADFRLSENGCLIFLELNGQAGMNLKSSIILQIGKDHFNDRLGFLRQFSETAVSFFQYAASLRSTKSEHRWSHQR